MSARWTRSALVLALATAWGCGSSPTLDASIPKNETPPAGGAAAPAKSAAPAMEATPYTAEQIRDATRAGRTYVFAVEAEGAPPKRRTMRFVGADASGALIESETANADGTQAVTEPAEHATWEELRDHAAFPKAIVTRSEAKRTTKLGELDCLVYTVSGESGETTTFYFAKTMPGPPVLFSTEKGGKVIRRSELVEYRGGGAADVATAGTARIVRVKMAMKAEGDVNEKELVAALQPQLAPLDPCVKPIPRGAGGVGSLNVRLTLSGQGPVSMRLESPVPPGVEKCMEAVFSSMKITTAGSGQSMILVELAPE